MENPTEPLFLKIGTTFDIFQAVGYLPKVNDLLYNKDSGIATSNAMFFKNEFDKPLISFAEDDFNFSIVIAVSTGVMGSKPKDWGQGIGMYSLKSVLLFGNFDAIDCPIEEKYLLNSSAID